MKIAVISDFHGLLPENIHCDLLLIAGDISPFNIQGNKEKMKEWIQTTFKEWVDNLDCDEVVMTPGNHDFIWEAMDSKTKRREFHNIFESKLICLWNESYIYPYLEDGKTKEVKIFGTPYCHIYGNWPFMRHTWILQEKFREIPDDINILLSHDPPFALGDTDVILKPKYPTQAHFSHLGNMDLKERVLNIIDRKDSQLKYLFCGHIHSGDHTFKEWFGIKYANVCLMDEYCNELIYPPLEFEYI